MESRLGLFSGGICFSIKSDNASDYKSMAINYSISNQSCYSQKETHALDSTLPWVYHRIECCWLGSDLMRHHQSLQKHWRVNDWPWKLNSRAFGFRQSSLIFCSQDCLLAHRMTKTRMGWSFLGSN
jgi:hypothetical protein